MNSRTFFYDFGRALYHVDSFYDEFAKQSNVSSALLWVLYALNDGNPHTQIEISNDWELHPNYHKDLCELHLKL